MNSLTLPNTVEFEKLLRVFATSGKESFESFPSLKQELLKNEGY